MARKYVFLHVSDIHLKEDELTSGIERDRDIRRQLHRDLCELRGQGFERLDGVLLTGDVAFAGKKIEFESAKEWLESIRSEFEFAEGRIWCVPGNHDVDRSKISESALRAQLRNSVRAGGEEGAASVLHDLLKDEAAHDALVGPLESYNEFFAKDFQCTTECPELVWQDRMPFGDGYDLVLNGLNSAIISDARDNLGDARLVVGDAQLTELSLDRGTVNVALCHHPPRWLFDHGSAIDYLNVRTSLQLFGHEHNERMDQTNNSVRIFAGALHPPRNATSWEPHYNIVELSIGENGESKHLAVRVWPRVWIPARTTFGRSPITGDERYVEYQLSLPAPFRTGVGPTPTESASDRERPKVVEEAPGVSLEKRQMPRDIVYRFFQLSWVARLRVAIELGLYDDEDAGVGEAEMARRVFARASERSQMEDLEAAVDRGLSVRGTEERANG